MNSYLMEIPETVWAALEVICGRYGVNPERAARLRKDGYDAEKVQKCVNELLTIFERYGDK